VKYWNSITRKTGFATSSTILETKKTAHPLGLPPQRAPERELLKAYE